MSSSESSFGQTLQFITSVKLQELEKLRLAYQAHARVLQDADAATDDITKVEILAKAIQSWGGSGKLDKSQVVGGKLSLHNLSFWLEQAKKDPSYDRKIVRGWVETLETHIRHTTMRFDFAKLFGNLFNEWMASGDSSTVAYQSPEEDFRKTKEDFIEISRKEMYEQKEKLSSIVFDEKPIDTVALRAYLEDLFSGEEGRVALEGLRKAISDFGLEFQKNTVKSSDIIPLINGLLADGLMGEEKRATLKAFVDNPTVLDEVASVLNMRFASLDTWAWPAEGMPVDMRRHLNGKYRAFTDPEIIDALVLQQIGISWQIKFKYALQDVFDGEGWKRPAKLSYKEQERRSEQLPSNKGSSTIDYQRNSMRRENFFMNQLANSVTSKNSYNDPDDENDYDMGPAVKQKLLHIMTTECYLNQATHGSHAVVRSDLEWFGPSLPHASILTILQFLGMSEFWLKLFQNFLNAPLRFDGESIGEVRIRKRGTPISYALSILFGELVLFGMDFAVNQKTDGIFLHRMHDDLWIWHEDPEKCATAWQEMNIYAKLVGITFNKEKTGSACVGKKSSSSLPPGSIRWGFLSFDTNKASFIIDQSEVDLHIIEFRRQLAATKSVFGWVNAYNKYMAFLLLNFGGQPAKCLGKSHRNDIIETIGRIQRELFPGTNNSPIGHLRTVLQSRFGIQDLPDGYFYFPIGSGGLELKNPLLELFGLEKEKERDDLPVDGGEDWAGYASKSDMFVFQSQIDEKTWAHLKELWESDTVSAKEKFKREQEGIEEFMSLKEYQMLRESTLARWGSLYDRMLEIACPVPMALTPTLKAAMEAKGLKRSRDDDDDDATSYRPAKRTKYGRDGERIGGRGGANAKYRASHKAIDLKFSPPGYAQTTGLVSSSFACTCPICKAETGLEHETPDAPAAWSSFNSYEQWVISMYGEEVIRKFGGLQVVDPDLIPIGMVQLFRTSRMKLDQ